MMHPRPCVPDVRQSVARLLHITAAMRGTFCCCWRRRKPGHPFCVQCLYLLPRQLRLKIYALDDIVRTNARKKAREWLRVHLNG